MIEIRRTFLAVCAAFVRFVSTVLPSGGDSGDGLLSLYVTISKPWRQNAAE